MVGPPPPVLTEREHEIMRALVAGKHVKSLGAKDTVYHHIQRVKDKAGISGPLYRLVLWYYRSFVLPS